MGYWTDLEKKKKAANGDSSVNGGGNQQPLTKEEGRRAASAQKTADNIANVNYGEAENADSIGTFSSYWGDKTNSYIPESIRNQSTVASTPSADGGRQGFNNIQNLAGMSTMDIADYYNSHPEQNFNNDMAGASEYLTGQYNNAMNDPTSEFYQSVQQKRNNVRNDPEQMYEYIYNGMKQNGWDENNVVSILQSVAGDDQEYLKQLAAGLDAYEANERQRIAQQNAGMSGITGSDMDKIATKIADRAGREAGYDVMQAVNDWAAQYGATPEEAQKVLGLVDTNYRDMWGIESNFSSKYKAPEATPSDWDQMNDDEKILYDATQTYRGKYRQYMERYKQENTDVPFESYMQRAMELDSEFAQAAEAIEDAHKALGTGKPKNTPMTEDDIVKAALQASNEQKNAPKVNELQTALGMADTPEQVDELTRQLYELTGDEKYNNKPSKQLSWRPFLKHDAKVAAKKAGYKHKWDEGYYDYINQYMQNPENLW